MRGGLGFDGHGHLCRAHGSHLGWVLQRGGRFPSVLKEEARESCKCGNSSSPMLWPCDSAGSVSARNWGYKPGGGGASPSPEIFLVMTDSEVLSSRPVTRRYH